MKSAAASCSRASQHSSKIYGWVPHHNPDNPNNAKNSNNFMKPPAVMARECTLVEIMDGASKFYSTQITNHDNNNNNLRHPKTIKTCNELPAALALPQTSETQGWSAIISN
jgi:hypothetical protein